MKELYISPVLNVLCYAPVERLAVDFGDLYLDSDADDEVISEEGDLGMDIF